MGAINRLSSVLLVMSTNCKRKHKQPTSDNIKMTHKYHIDHVIINVEVKLAKAR